MKIKVTIILSLILVIIGGTGVYFYLQKVPSTLPKEKYSSVGKDFISKKIASMSLEEKIGQMIFMDYRKTDYENGFFNDVETYQPGGFILFKENITSYQDVKNLNQRLQKLSKIPLFIGTDQEGGRVQRFAAMPDQSFTIIPSMERVGATNDPLIAKQIGTILGSELATVGINVDFAPVLDINSNLENTVIGDRSFGSTKELVTTMGTALAKGLKKVGVIPVYKHFPGHGDTVEDSHYSFANIYKTKEQLMDLELYPFKSVAHEDDAMIMVGHLSLPNILNDQTPATLSPTIIQILKEELGYDGVIISDALNMGALTNHYSEEEIIINAIKAGIDILLMPSSLSNTVATIKKAIDDGKIKESRIEESVYKILKLKNQYRILDEAKEKSLTEKEWTEHQEYINSLF